VPKICYTPRKFHKHNLLRIELVNGILEDYATQGYDLTLRQLYYQLVARSNETPAAVQVLSEPPKVPV
jgi:hypothetical protein